jgi:hypothetical protein
MACVERWMIENNVIELWFLALEYEYCDNDCYEYLKKGKPWLCSSSTCVFVCHTGMWLYGRYCKR